MPYPNDPYDQEEIARKMDKESARFERNHFYCEKCLRWINRYLPHNCIMKKEGENVGL